MYITHTYDFPVVAGCVSSPQPGVDILLVPHGTPTKVSVVHPDTDQSTDCLFTIVDEADGQTGYSFAVYDFAATLTPDSCPVIPLIDLNVSLPYIEEEKTFYYTVSLFQNLNIFYFFCNIL